MLVVSRIGFFGGRRVTGDGRQDSMSASAVHSFFWHVDAYDQDTRTPEPQDVSSFGVSCVSPFDALGHKMSCTCQLARNKMPKQLCGYLQPRITLSGHQDMHTHTHTRSSGRKCVGLSRQGFKDYCGKQD